MLYAFTNYLSHGVVQEKLPLLIFRILEKLGVLDSEYSRFNNFKVRVLDPSIKQINENTDITIKVEQHKTGRSVTGFSFRFKQKVQPKVEQKPTRNEIQTHLISLSK